MSVAVVIVDMQDAYFESEPLKSQCGELTAKCNELAAAARQKGLPVINVRTQHERNKSTWTLSMLDDDQGFSFNEDTDAQTVEGLQVDGAVQLTKTRDSSFFGTDLSARLKNFGAETIILCGVSTHTCIATTAADAFARNLRVILAKEATASYVPEAVEPTLDMLHSEYRERVLANAEILQILEETET